MLRNALATTLLAASLLPLTARVAAQPLDLVESGFPAVNCLFSPDCRIGARDSVHRFTLPDTTGEARLQSRTFAPGAPGTAGAGMYLYLYRIDLSDVRPNREFVGCVESFTIPAASLARLDYDGDGNPDDAFVGTRGGLGSIGPSALTRAGGLLRFDIPFVCYGRSTYFFGFASRLAPVEVEASVVAGLPDTRLDVEARAPAHPTIDASFTRGDLDGTGRLEISDAVGVLGFLFQGTREPVCLDAADANDDGRVELTDAISILSFLFLQGDAPPAPFGECGSDATADRLGCEASTAACEEVRCPDPAVESIEFAITRRDTAFRGRVRIRANVTNLGGAYRSSAGQQSIVLEEVPLGGRGRVVAQQPFVNLDAGEEITVTWYRDWNASSPAEGEFPPTYRAYLSYDPDISIDGNDANDDCGRSNNVLERSGTGINDLF